MFIERHTTPGLAINSYVIGDENVKRCVVIDPVRDVKPLLALAAQHGCAITDILETHVHADFASGSKELKEALGGAPKIHASGMGGQKWTPVYADNIVKDGDQLLIGDMLIEAMHTPGHTPEHISWKVYDLKLNKETPTYLFSGDFLFVGDVGRPDLLGQEALKTLAHEQYKSVFERLEGLPDFVEIYPAHGSGSLCGKMLSAKPHTTLGFERQFNRAFLKLPEEEWIHALLEGMPKAPPYFAHMKQVNVKGSSPIGHTLPGKKLLSPAEVNQMKDALIVDGRSKEAFSSAHIPGSINIPFTPMLPTYAGFILPYNQNIVLILDEQMDVESYIRPLIDVGLDDIAGYAHIRAFENLGASLESLKSITVEELAKRIKAGETVVDVRTEAEWLNFHIKEALHHPLGSLDSAFLESLPKNKPVSFICGSGLRSAIMSSLFKKAGVTQAMNVLGGMQAWKQQGLSTV